MSKKHGTRKMGQVDPVTQVSDHGRLSHGQARPTTKALWAQAGGATAASMPGALKIATSSPVAPAPGLVVPGGGDRFALEAVETKPDPPFDKEWAQEALKAERERISSLQERLYAEQTRSLLLIFQAIDTGGKDGTIRSVLKSVNPQGCAVTSFKVPSADELAHDFLWRYHARTPARGMIGVFNRSHYEDVLVVRVKNLVSEDVWTARYRHINDFERMLADSGTVILKFFLHISKDEQKERLTARLADPAKHWKFDPADLVERQSWDAYQDAFADALGHCSTPRAPWLVVPADRKWLRDYLIAKTIADTLDAMNLRFPEGKHDLAGIVVPD